MTLFGKKSLSEKYKTHSVSEIMIDLAGLAQKKPVLTDSEDAGDVLDIIVERAITNKTLGEKGSLTEVVESFGGLAPESFMSFYTIQKLKVTNEYENLVQTIKATEKLYPNYFQEKELIKTYDADRVEINAILGNYKDIMEAEAGGRESTFVREAKKQKCDLSIYLLRPKFWQAPGLKPLIAKFKKGKEPLSFREKSLSYSERHITHISTTDPTELDPFIPLADYLHRGEEALEDSVTKLLLSNIRKESDNTLGYLKVLHDVLDVREKVYKACKNKVRKRRQELIKKHKGRLKKPQQEELRELNEEVTINKRIVNNIENELDESIYQLTPLIRPLIERIKPKEQTNYLNNKYKQFGAITDHTGVNLIMADLFEPGKYGSMIEDDLRIFIPGTYENHAFSDDRKSPYNATHFHVVPEAFAHEEKKIGTAGYALHREAQLIRLKDRIKADLGFFDHVSHKAKQDEEEKKYTNEQHAFASVFRKKVGILVDAFNEASEDKLLTSAYKDNDLDGYLNRREELSKEIIKKIQDNWYKPTH